MRRRSQRACGVVGSLAGRLARPSAVGAFAVGGGHPGGAHSRRRPQLGRLQARQQRCPVTAVNALPRVTQGQPPCPTVLALGARDCVQRAADDSKGDAMRRPACGGRLRCRHVSFGRLSASAMAASALSATLGTHACSQSQVVGRRCVSRGRAHTRRRVSVSAKQAPDDDDNVSYGAGWYDSTRRLGKRRSEREALGAPHTLRVPPSPRLTRPGQLTGGQPTRGRTTARIGRTCTRTTGRATCTKGA
jgi:hypothetical protein